MTTNELIIEYAERFGENFPLYHFMGVSEDKIRAMIEKALEDNAPIKAEYIEGADY